VQCISLSANVEINHANLKVLKLVCLNETLSHYASDIIWQHPWYTQNQTKQGRVCVRRDL